MTRYLKGTLLIGLCLVTTPAWADENRNPTTWFAAQDFRGPVRFSTTSTVGFFGVTASAQAAAITQTYSTADRTHANFTSADLTGITTSTTGSALAEPGAGYTQSELQQNFRRIQDQYNALRADVADLKQLVNSLIDDLQAYGLEP